MKKENYKSAKEYMVTVISHDQNDISYNYNLSLVLDKLSDFKTAATFYLNLLHMAANLKNVSKKNTHMQDGSKTKIYKT